MLELLSPIAHACTVIIELLGIFIITGTALYTLAFAAYKLIRHDYSERVFRQVRQRLGRGILLGLEFLVAADIIETVAVELTFRSVGVLAVIVLIRTFLSFSMELELTGHWPWQQGGKGAEVDPDPHPD